MTTIDLTDDPPTFGNGYANGWLLNLHNDGPTIRLTPTAEGARTITDPEQLRREARRLQRAADHLEAEQNARLNPTDARADLVAHA